MSKWVVKRISCTENIQVNALARIATTLPIKKVVLLSVYLQVTSSIAAIPICSASETVINWMHEIEAYIQIGKLPEGESKFTRFEYRLPFSL